MAKGTALATSSRPATRCGMILGPFWRRLVAFQANGGARVATQTRFDDLEGGMRIDEALAAFVDGCNVPYQTLWITDSWSQPLFERLRASVRGPISDELADALRRVVQRQYRLEDLVDWAERPEPKPPFTRFAEERRGAREMAEADAIHEFLAGHVTDLGGDPPLAPGHLDRWSLHASLHATLASTMCPGCGVPGVKREWKAAPHNESGLAGGVTVVCPCCQALLDVIAR
jgi:hypothetical protein